MNGFRMFAIIRAGLLVCMLSGTPGEGVLAQALDLGGNGEDSLPIQIEAEQGLEWREDYSVVTARGNATATRGDIRVKAATLSAFYRERDDGDTEIWRLEAVGDVVITAPQQSAHADRGSYDVQRGILVLEGDGGVRLAGEHGEITAEDQVEYWERERMVVARGNAHARQGEQGLRAAVLVAYLTTDEAGRTQVQRVEAFDDVHVYTPEEQASAERGVYTPDTGSASLVGSVRITRGANQLSGCRAEVDLQSGVNKLFGCRESGQGGQVRGRLLPEEETERKPGE